MTFFDKLKGALRSVFFAARILSNAKVTTLVGVLFFVLFSENICSIFGGIFLSGDVQNPLEQGG